MNVNVQNATAPFFRVTGPVEPNGTDIMFRE